MQDALPQLGRAVGVHAAMVGFALHTHYVAVADRAALRHMELLVTSGVFFVLDYLYDFGDHVAAALHHYPVADHDPQALDLIHVVQGGTAHGCAADWHRLKPGDRRELPGAADLGLDVFHLSHSAASRILVSDGPTRRLPREPKPFLQPL